MNGVMAVILRYSTEFVYDVVVNQLPRFQNLLLIVYNHIKTICAIACMYVCILRARVQPTLDPYAEAFYSRPIVLTQEGRSLVNDV